MKPRRLAAFALIGVGVASAFALAQRRADAQRIDPRRASTFVVGAPTGASPMERVDGRRSGLARQPLPTGSLRIAWRKTIGLSVEQAALVGSDGTIAIVTARGDVVFLDVDGEEIGHVTVDGRSAGPPAMTSDGTIVFATSTGEAVGVRRSSPRPRFVTRIGGERNLRAAPLSLDDGGVVLATMTDLVVLDGEGNVRTRVTLPDAPGAALLASGDKVLVVTVSGLVYGWTPGREPVRLGSFGAPIDGGAALADANTLVAVIEGNHLVDLDLAHGTRGTRSIAPQGLYLGPPSVRRAEGGDAGTGFLATVLALTPSRVFVSTLDPAGVEVVRAPIGNLSVTVLPDGGPAPLVAPLHVGPLVDARGAIAFAATDGHVGLVSAEGAVEVIGELLCSRSPRSSGVAGLTPVARGAFVVTCEGGSVVEIAGPEAETLHRNPSVTRPLPPSGTSSARPGVTAPPGDDDDDDTP